MKILLIPLDERPCNFVFPQEIANSGHDVNLIVPDRSLLGHKKQPADTTALAQFLLHTAQVADAAVISLDMLLYGGLVPSRLHHEAVGTFHERLAILRQVKEANPHLRIFAFMTLMRAPRYNSSDEEPDYYSDYGHALFRRAWLKDRIERRTTQALLQTQSERDEQEADEKELAQISIPSDVIADYEHRRGVNADLNEAALDLVEEGIIDGLIFPQDDSAPYGYTAQAQRRLRARMREHPSSFQHVFMYPGSDEVALTLLARAVNVLRGTCPRVRAYFSSLRGPEIIPNYEDRPLYETLKAHCDACGARLVEPGETADIELFINTAGKVMQEAQYWSTHDVTYDSWRNLQNFVANAARLVHKGRTVAVCDSAYSNGGDPELVARLDEAGILLHVCSYAGWNTNANTLGTTLAQAILSNGSQENLWHNLVARLCEDVFYQSIVRWKTEQYIHPLGGTYFDVSPCESKACQFVSEEILREYNKLTISHQLPIRSLTVTFPWHRLFEIECHVQLDETAVMHASTKADPHGISHANVHAVSCDERLDR